MLEYCLNDYIHYFLISQIFETIDIYHNIIVEGPQFKLCLHSISH